MNAESIHPSQPPAPEKPFGKKNEPSTGNRRKDEEAVVEAQPKPKEMPKLNDGDIVNIITGKSFYRLLKQGNAYVVVSSNRLEAGKPVRLTVMLVRSGKMEALSQELTPRIGDRLMIGDILTSPVQDFEINRAQDLQDAE